MPQPPGTPSPHRFLHGQRRAPLPTKDVRPPSTLRKQVATAPKDTPNVSQQPIQPSQFAQTPRFSFGKSRAAFRDQRSPSPPKPAVVQAFRGSTRPAEEVEDAAGLSDDDEMLDDERAQALPTTEHGAETNPEWTNDLVFSPKRRRVDGSDAKLSPTRPSFKQPQPVAPQLPRPTPQSTSAQTQDSTGTDSAGIQRPAFLRPSVAPQEPREPLPETFSPHKRGQKFVPGGMAATMQQWVIETGQAAVQSRKGQGYLRGEDYVLHVKIVRVTGDGPFTVRGRLANGDAVQVLLAGGSNERRDIHPNAVVGIRAPTWDLELDGRRWTVGVDWRVLS